MRDDRGEYVPSGIELKKQDKAIDNELTFDNYEKVTAPEPTSYDSTPF